MQSETFSLPAYEQFLSDNRGSIERFKRRQQQAFESERQRWQELSDLGSSEPPAAGETQAAVPEGSQAVESHVHGSVWKVSVTPGSRVEKGQTLVIVEAMKMEIAIESSVAGTLVEVLCAVGQAVVPGQRVAVVQSAVVQSDGGPEQASA
jgi:urea carboxylase